MAGSATWRRLEQSDFTNLVGASSADLDLRDRQAVFRFMKLVRPKYVILAAAKVGGILANDTWPVEFISENLQMQVNVMDAALETGVDRLIFLGSSCIYPKHAPQPLREEFLLTGGLELNAIVSRSGTRRPHFSMPASPSVLTAILGPNFQFHLPFYRLNNLVFTL